MISVQLVRKTLIAATPRTEYRVQLYRGEELLEELTVDDAHGLALLLKAAVSVRAKD